MRRWRGFQTPRMVTGLEGDRTGRRGPSPWDSRACAVDHTDPRESVSALSQSGLILELVSFNPAASAHARLSPADGSGHGRRRPPGVAAGKAGFAAWPRRRGGRWGAGSGPPRASKYTSGSKIGNVCFRKRASAHEEAERSGALARVPPRSFTLPGPRPAAGAETAAPRPGRWCLR